MCITQLGQDCNKGLVDDSWRRLKWHEMSVELAIGLLVADMVALGAYSIYVPVAVGMPENLSMTYYMMEDRRKGSGAAFPLLICFICVTMIPVWIATSRVMPGMGPQCAWMPWVVLGGLLCVAGTSHYKRNKAVWIFHYAMAIMASAVTAVWMCCTSSMSYLIMLLCGVAVLLGACVTKTFRRSWLFWWETGGSYSIIIMLFIINLQRMLSI